MVNYKLNDWFILAVGDPYCAPELMEHRLCGKVEGHPSRPDGSSVITSATIGKIGDRLVTFTGSVIELGEPKADYEALFPNARTRILSTVKAIQPC